MRNVYYTYTLICMTETTFCNCNKLHVSEKETWSCQVTLTHIWFRYTLIEMEFTEQRSIGQWLLKRVSRIQSFVESEGVPGITKRKLYSRVEYLDKQMKFKSIFHVCKRYSAIHIFPPEEKSLALYQRWVYYVIKKLSVYSIVKYQDLLFLSHAQLLKELECLHLQMLKSKVVQLQDLFSIQIHNSKNI